MLESIGRLKSDQTKYRNERVTPKSTKRRTSAALLSNYKRILEKEVIDEVQHHLDKSQKVSFNVVVSEMIRERRMQTRAHRVFESLDTNKDGKLCLEEFVEGIVTLGCDKTKDELSNLYLRL